MNARTDTRLAPFSLEAEQSVIGGLMLRSTALAEISDWLAPEDFFRADHQALYRAIVELAAQGKPSDPVTMMEWVDANGAGQEAIRSGYVLELTNNTPSAANIAAYADIVREKSKLRQLATIGSKLGGAALAPKADASILASQATGELGTLIGDARSGGLRPLSKSIGGWYAQLQERFDRQEQLSGVATPFEQLNAATLGLQAGDLIVLAGRTSMGKSVMGFQMAGFNGLAGHRTSVFSLEMRADQFLQRVASAFGRIPHENLRLPRRMNDVEWADLSEVNSKLAQAPIDIDDQPSLTAQQIVARLKRQHLRSPVTLAIVDHLHEIKRPGRDPVNELGDAARLLRAAAKEMRIPIVLLAQLNRATAGRADHRPSTADLRASGSIEEIADVIMLIHREDYYDKQTHLKSVVEVILAKGRDLPAGESVYLKNRYDQMRLEDWEGPLPERPTAATEEKSKGFSRSKTKSVRDYAAAKDGE